MRDGIAEPWGTRTPYGPGEDWPVRVDCHLAGDLTVGDIDRWVRTAAVLHSNGDGLDIAVKDGRIAGVRGRADDRVNHGRLDPKDLFGWQANNAPDRVRTPLVRDRDGELRESTWDEAMDRIVRRSRELLDTEGPGSLGFYTSGQLFAEEFYTLAAIARGGLGTDHLDGNTRLCTATAGEALKESFGCDGQPGSYADVDHADVIAMFGHNAAATQPVLWSRILDRLDGPEPPRLLCVDPRETPVAKAATLHLAPLPGTNVALMNAILHEVVGNGWCDREWIDRHTVGYDDLAAAVRDYPPERAEDICGVAADDIRAAAELVGTAERLLCTVLQGFYQSHQATAAAVQVNNLVLLRGMLGKPGCGVLQMNGQPSAENTRECGADGDLTGFRNWNNDAHVAQLEELWNVPAGRIPHDGPPTHLMKMLDLAESGDLRFWWISATNPAVSLPELARVRRILGQERLFVVVQDAFRTETAEFADVVLPTAMWGEKTGTFTNADRTVHLSEKAVEPPGTARPDLDIFLDYARRMDLRDRDGAAFPPWHDAESAFDAWRRASAGRPCDYSGLSYEKLRVVSGIQWPCDESHPDGTHRLYADGTFFAGPDYCEDYGKDLHTGEPIGPDAYRAFNPDGKAMLKPAEYLVPREPPTAEYPFALITGRTLYHFHTRTKTGRAPQLESAAPEPWAELSRRDAERAGISEGDLVEIRTPRGRVRVKARPGGIREGVLFLPFHYGYWDTEDPSGTDGTRAANELTITAWDPASKQPLFKTAAAALRKLSGAAAEQPTAPGDRMVSERVAG